MWTARARLFPSRGDRTGSCAALRTIRPVRTCLFPGSIAVDGISFTVARLGETTFTVSVIPHTRTLTNAGAWEAGDRVNLEYDLIGKAWRSMAFA